MIHRLLHDVLTDGIAAITADITLLEDLFAEHYEIEATEVAAIREYFETNGFNVINGYARSDSIFPLVSIVLASEGESTTFIGDDGGQVLDEDDPYYTADIESAIWEHVYHLYVYTGNSDITAAYYELAKVVLLAGLNTLTEDGCFGYSMSGMDLAPDPRYVPEHLFVRQLVFKTQREFQRIDKDSRLSKAFRVEGIHIDSAGSPREVGGVKTLVTPYVLGDDDG